MRDGSYEATWTELTLPQKEEARALLPEHPPVVRGWAGPTGGRAQRLKRDAARLYWRLSHDMEHVMGFDPDVLF